MPQKTLDLTRSVYDLCTQYPELKDLMASVGFDEITKPGRLQTMGRLMTIPKGCQAKKLNLTEVVAAFQQAGFEVEGYGSSMRGNPVPAPSVWALVRMSSRCARTSPPSLPA